MQCKNEEYSQTTQNKNKQKKIENKNKQWLNETYIIQLNLPE